MGKIEKTVEIRAPPEKVWPMLFWDKLPEWLDMFKMVECTSEKRDSAGATFHVIGEAAGMKTEFDVELLRLVKYEKAAWRSSLGGFGESTIRHTRDGTEITFVINYALPDSIFGTLLDKLIVGRAIKKSVDRGFEKLRRILE